MTSHVAIALKLKITVPMRPIAALQEAVIRSLLADPSTNWQWRRLQPCPASVVASAGLDPFGPRRRFVQRGDKHFEVVAGEDDIDFKAIVAEADPSLAPPALIDNTDGDRLSLDDLDVLRHVRPLNVGEPSA